MTDETDTVRAWVHTENTASYEVFIPVDFADQLDDAGDAAWVSLAFVQTDEYISLRAKDITHFQREFTMAEKQRRHTMKGPPRQ